jgi:hypothetical protein
MLNKNYHIHFIIISYILFGSTFILMDLRFPNWFFALTLFFGFKWLFNYRKCTISYIEVKLRGVKKEEGYLYRLLDYIINYRTDKNIIFVYIFQTAFIAYHYIKTEGFKGVI